MAKKRRKGGFKKGIHNPGTKLEHQIRAKAMYLDSGGKMSLGKIAEEVGVNPGTISEWRKKNDWDADLKTVQETLDKKFKEKMLTSRKVQSMLTDIPEEQIINAVNSLVGKQVAEAVSDFLTKVHRRDIEDLADLNKAIKYHLMDETIGELKPIDISNLVAAKTNIIKAVRMIFGQQISDQPTVQNNQVLQVMLSAEQYSALNELRKEGMVDLPEPNKQGEN